MKVKAIKLGYYDIIRRYPGDVFEIKNEKEFSKIWMQKLDVEQVDEQEEEAPVVKKPKAKRAKAEKPAASPTGDAEVI